MLRKFVLLILALGIPATAHATVQHFYVSKMVSINTAADCYVAIDGGFECSTTALGAAVWGIVATPGTFSWKATLVVAPGSGNSVDVVLSVNGNTTGSGTCNIADAATTCTSTSVSVSQGDTVSMLIKPTSGPSASTIMLDTSFTPTTSGQVIRMGNSRSNLGAAQFGTMISNAATSATESAVWMVSAMNSLAQRICAKANTATGATNERIFTLSKNTSAEAGLRVTITNAIGTAVLCDDDGGVDIAPGDTLSIAHTVTNAPTASIGAWGVMFTPDTSDQFEIPTMSSSDASTVANNYMAINGMDGAAGSQPNGTETNVRTVINSDIRITGMTAKLDTAPGGGKSYTYALFLNGALAPNNFLFDLDDPATSASVTGSYYPDDNSQVSVRIVPNSGPAASTHAITLVATGSVTPPSGCDEDSIFIDFNGGTDGVAPNSTTLNASLYGQTGFHFTRVTAGEITYATAAAMTVGGTYPTMCNDPYNSASPSTVGLNVAPPDGSVQYVTYTIPQGVAAQVVGTIKFKTTFAATAVLNYDVFTIFSVGTGYTNVNLNGDGATLYIGMEAPNNGGCTGSSPATNRVAISTNTEYYITALYTSVLGADNMFVNVYNGTTKALVGSLNSDSCWNEAASTVRLGFVGAAGDVFNQNLRFGWLKFCQSGTCTIPYLPTSSSGGGLINLMMSPKTPKKDQ